MTRPTKIAGRLITGLLVITTAACSAGSSDSSQTSSASPAHTSAAAPKATRTTVAPPPDDAATNDPETASPAELKALTDQTCHTFKGEVLWACGAYVLDSIYTARLPLYQFGTSTNVTAASVFRKRFEYRYEGDARQSIENQITSWPAPRLLAVDPPHIRISSLNFSNGGRTVKLETIETWHVVTTGEKPVFTEEGKKHTVIMERAAHGLPRWVVTRITNLR
jgi:hypothetical protein